MKSALKPVINVLKYICDFLDMLCRKLCLVIGIVMVVDLFLGVFTRFVLNSPLNWTEEIARFCMLWFAFIGGSVEMKKGNLINFSFIVDKLKPNAKRVAEIIDLCLVLVFLIVFLYVGADAMKIFALGKASVTRINLAWTAVGIYAGSAIMVVHGIYQLLIKLTGETVTEVEVQEG